MSCYSNRDFEPIIRSQTRVNQLTQFPKFPCFLPYWKQYCLTPFLSPPLSSLSLSLTIYLSVYLPLTLFFIIEHLRHVTPQASQAGLSYKRKRYGVQHKKDFRKNANRTSIVAESADYAWL